MAVGKMHSLSTNNDNKVNSSICEWAWHLGGLGGVASLLYIYLLLVLLSKIGNPDIQIICSRVR